MVGGNELGPFFAAIAGNSFQLLAKHRKMSDGRLGRVSATNHKIDLVPGAKPVTYQPYRAGPRVREAESAE
jgi:hypothetical protein